MAKEAKKNDPDPKLAASIVPQATGETQADDDEKPEKNPAAVALGRLGGG